MRRWLFLVCLLALLPLAPRSCAPGTNQKSTRAAAAPGVPGQASGSHEIVTISVLKAYAWRDWMPVVEHPGSDGGSPLYAKIRVRLENTHGTTATVAFSITITAADRRTYHLMLPVVYHESQEWNQTLAVGEIKVVELVTHDGPYLPVGSSISATITMTDNMGQTMSVPTPLFEINKTS